MQLECRTNFWKKKNCTKRSEYVYLICSSRTLHFFLHSFVSELNWTHAHHPQSRPNENLQYLSIVVFGFFLWVSITLYGFGLISIYSVSMLLGCFHMCLRVYLFCHFHIHVYKSFCCETHNNCQIWLGIIDFHKEPFVWHDYF